MKITKLVLGQLQANCYIVHAEKSLEATIIDPGDDGEGIKQKILALDLKPKAILATHGHFDHIGAALDLQLSFEIPFFASKKDEFLVKRVRESSLHWTGIDPGPPPKINQYLEDINAGNFRRKNFWLQVIHTPGHTPGSVCFYQKPHLFVGDLIFAGGGVGRTDFKYSSKEDLVSSIQKIKKLPGDTIVHPGHGEEFLLKNYM